MYFFLTTNIATNFDVNLPNDGRFGAIFAEREQTYLTFLLYNMRAGENQQKNKSFKSYFPFVGFAELSDEAGFFLFTKNRFKRLTLLQNQAWFYSVRSVFKLIINHY